MINRACERWVPEAADRANVQRRYEAVLTAEGRLAASDQSRPGGPNGMGASNPAD